MRVVGGTLSGRRLKMPPSDTRPTSERVREALASALIARGLIEDSRVLDLFAGSGALGLEALSRGAQSLVAVERDRRAVDCIRDNARSLGVEAQTKVLRLDLLRPGSSGLGRMSAALGGPAQLVFLDPPYKDWPKLEPLLEGLHKERLVEAGTVLVVEHGARDPQPELAHGRVLANYRYGDTAIALFEAMP